MQACQSLCMSLRNYSYCRYCLKAEKEIKTLVMLNKTESNKGLTELQRMGTCLVIAVMAMISAGTVEIYRLKHKESVSNSSSLSIFWQVLQYMMIRCIRSVHVRWSAWVLQQPRSNRVKELCKRAVYGFNIARELR